MKVLPGVVNFEQLVSGVLALSCKEGFSHVSSFHEEFRSVCSRLNVRFLAPSALRYERLETFETSHPDSFASFAAYPCAYKAG